jgi:hypothetical protein
LLGQETLTKTLFITQKLGINQELTVKKKLLLTALFISILIFSAITGTQFVNFGQANPYIRGSEIEETIPPPEGTKPPTVSISTSKNHSYLPNSFLLNFTATIKKSNYISLSVNKIYYKPSWKRERTDVDCVALFLKNNYTWPSSYSINLTGVPEGPHWIEVFAVATGFAYETRQETKGIYQTTYYVGYEITGSSRIDFTIDNTPSRTNSTSSPDVQPFPTTVVTASIGAASLIVGVGFILYFEKRKY